MSLCWCWIKIKTMHKLITWMEQDYGKKWWYSMSDEEQLAAIAAFMKHWAAVNKKKYILL